MTRNAQEQGSGRRRSIRERLYEISAKSALDPKLRYAHLLKHLRRFKTGTLPVLDIGCGNQGVAMYLGEQPEIVGIDLTFPRREATGSGPKRVCANAFRLPFRDQQFEAVIAVDTLEHVPPVDRQAFINEAFRVARTVVGVVVPVSPAADRAEKDLMQICQRNGRDAPVWLQEHRLYGPPTREAVIEYLGVATLAQGRGLLNLSVIPGLNAKAWLWLTWMSMRSRTTYLAINLLGSAVLPAIPVLDRPPFYRYTFLSEMSKE